MAIFEGGAKESFIASDNLEILFCSELGVAGLVLSLSSTPES
jgi:hypothetical protein